MKVLFLLSALGLFSVLFSFSNTPDPDRAIPFTEVDIEKFAREQRIGQLRFAGMLEDGREILLFAARAAPLQGDMTRISAESVQIQVGLAEPGYLVLSSDSALVNLTGRTMRLDENVRVTSPTGYRVDSDQIIVSMSDRSLRSPGPVSVTGPSLTLMADRMEAFEEPSGQGLVFNGAVQMLYTPED